MHGIIRVSKGSPCKNEWFGSNYCVSGPVLLVCFRKIYSSTCVHHLNSLVGCGTLFYIKWCEFQRDRVEKIWMFDPKYSVFDLVLLVCLEKIYPSTCNSFLVGIVGCRMKFCIQHRSMERISRRNIRIRCSFYYPHVYLVFIMGARNLSDKLVTFFC
jgi:hypothetical protein